jgi:tetratricopeptide (TPR) repeat protein
MSGRRDEAVGVFEQLIRLEPSPRFDSVSKAGESLPNSAYGSILRGLLRGNGGFAGITWDGDLDRTIAACRQAVQRDPNAAWAHVALADTLQGKGELDAAIPAYRKALELDPRFTSARDGLVEALLARGDPDAAEAAYRRLLGFIAPQTNYGNFSSLLGQEFEKKGDLEKAIRWGTGDRNEWVKYCVWLGRRSRDPDDISYYRKAIELDARLDPGYLSASSLGLMGCVSGPAPLSAATALFPGRTTQSALPHYCLAEALRSRGDLDGAIDAYRRATEIQPRAYDAYVGWAEALRARGDPEGADALQRKAFELNPVGSCLRLGSILTSKGDLKGAIDAYSRAIDLDPKRPDAWLSRADMHSRLRQWDKVIADDSEAIKLDPSDADSWLTRGKHYQTMGENARAVDDFSEVIKLAPRGIEGWLTRGNAYHALGQNENALADFSKAVEVDPNSTEARACRGDFYRSLGQKDKASADYFQLGTILGLRDDQKGALDAYSRAIELDPKRPDARFSRAGVHSRLRQWDDAIADDSEGIKLEPSAARFWWHRGTCHSAKGENARAVDDFAKAIQLDPANVGSWLGRGGAYHALGQNKDAQEDLSKAIDLDPKSAEAWSSLGDVDGSLGQKDKAIADYTKAMELSKGNSRWETWTYRLKRGATYGDMGEDGKAVADYTECLQACAEFSKWDALSLYKGTWAPTLGQACFLRATAYVRLKRFREALADFGKALEVLGPNTGSMVYNDAAWLLATCPEVELRDPRRAVELAKKAVELAPEAGLFWNTLGVAHYRLGEHKDAIEALHKSMELRQGGDPFDWLFLAMAHHKLGDRDEARKWYDKSVDWLENNGQALEKNPRHAEALRRFREEAEQVLELSKK